MQSSGGGPDLAASTCSGTVDAYCAAQGPCVRDATAAQQASSWCPDGGTAVSVTLQHCAGGQIVVIANYSDSASHFVYSGGTLAAIFSGIPHGGTNDLLCVAGPATFAVPSGCDTPTTLCSGP